jgi:hypothetical protein
MFMSSPKLLWFRSVRDGQKVNATVEFMIMINGFGDFELFSSTYIRYTESRRAPPRRSDPAS